MRESYLNKNQISMDVDLGDQCKQEADKKMVSKDWPLQMNKS